MIEAEERRSTRARIAVIVPAFNAAQTIAAQLEALVGQDLVEPWELVVADNGSTDETRAIAERVLDGAPFARVIDASGERGAAFARMSGVRSSSAPLLAFCDADDEVSNRWLRTLLDVLSEAHVAGGAEMHVLGTGPPSAAQKPASAWRELEFLPYASGSNFAIRREVLLALGGFDTLAEPAEDVDLCWRAQIAGYRLAFDANALVVKRGRVAARDTFRQYRSYGRADAFLQQRFAPHGAPPHGPLRAGRTWLWLAVHVGGVRNEAKRRELATIAGRRVGRVLGSIEHRTVCL